MSPQDRKNILGVCAFLGYWADACDPMATCSKCGRRERESGFAYDEQSDTNLCWVCRSKMLAAMQAAAVARAVRRPKAAA